MKLKEGFHGERYLFLPSNVIHILEEHPMMSDLYITHIGYFPKALFHYRIRPLGAEEYIFIYCIKGTGWYKIYGHTYHIKENDFFIIPPKEPHCYGSENKDPWTIYWIHFSGKKSPYFGENYHKPRSFSVTMSSRILERISIFDEIITILEKGYEEEKLIYACSCMHHFLASIRFLDIYRSVSKVEGNSENRVVYIATHYMLENIEKRIKLSDIASYLKISPSYFSSYYTRITGINPMLYFNNMKMQYACKLLETTNLKVNQISLKLGYTDPYYFTRLFTQIVGMPPTKYKAKAGE